jgi:hypothetical protein
MHPHTYLSQIVMPSLKLDLQKYHAIPLFYFRLNFACDRMAMLLSKLIDGEAALLSLCG